MMRIGTRVAQGLWVNKKGWWWLCACWGGGRGKKQTECIIRREVLWDKILNKA